MTVTIQVDADLHATIAECIAARNEGIAQAEDADRSGWNKALIDQAIDALALTRQPFSANDVRVLLPDDLPGPLFGARFQHAANNRGVIRFHGWTSSSKKNTHAHPIKVWIGRAQA
jgi:hypothetical protein